MHLTQLALSAYLKNLRYLNLRDCKLNQKAFNELLASPHLKSLEVLVARNNRLKFVEGPHSDLDDMTEKEAKNVMSLKLLDLRENKLTHIFQEHAVNFLRETIVLMWDNPFNDIAEVKQLMRQEYFDPSCLFRACEEFDDSKI